MKEFGIKNIIITIFVAGAVLAFLAFSGIVKLKADDPTKVGTIEVWGNIPESVIKPYIEKIKSQKLTVNYFEKDLATYESELINAFAAGKGPDLFIMPHEYIIRHSDKVLEIPYSSFSQRDYQNTYVDESHLFRTDTGIIAFPLTVDPLITYYNKALLASAFLIDIPEYWDDVIPYTKEITEKGAGNEVFVSGISLGTFDNIRHAKDIITTLILQNGHPIVRHDPVAYKKQSALVFDETLAQKSQQSVDFYTSFANPQSSTYSWNEALPDSQDKFIAGELGMYFGKASELELIKRKNPNLDFDVALFPQLRTSREKVTYGDMLGVAIGKQTKNVPASILIASQLTSTEILGDLADDLFVAPARKDLLKNKPEDSFKTLVFNSAIISDAWIDSDAAGTDSIFRTLIQNINTEAILSMEALRRASADLNELLDRTINLTLVAPEPITTQ